MTKNPIHPKPIYRLTVDGTDITNRIDGQLIDLTLTDNRGLDADELELRLDDTDGRLDLPPRGAVITLSIGWKHSGLVHKGRYTVDEVEHSGAPDVLCIRARSADMRTGLTTQRERSWHDTTLGNIVKTIAGENGLTPMITESLAAEQIAHVDQTNEVDVNLLTRLAHQFDAIATVKDGRLLFIPTGLCASASGLALPSATITRSDGDQHRFSIADRDSYTGVRATYNDIGSAKKMEVIVGKDGEKAYKSKNNEVGHSADNVKTLRHVFANKANATRAAKSEWKKLQRGLANFSITLARGRPDLFPDVPATVSGFKRAIDNTDWIITRVVHNLNDSGYTTALDLEIKATEVGD